MFLFASSLLVNGSANSFPLMPACALTQQCYLPFTLLHHRYFPSYFLCYVRVYIAVLQLVQCCLAVVNIITLLSVVCVFLCVPGLLKLQIAPLDYSYISCLDYSVFYWCNRPTYILLPLSLLLFLTYFPP